MKKAKEAMNILIISPLMPYPPDRGGAIRVYNIIKILSKDYRISLICFQGKNNEACLLELHKYCDSIQTFPVPYFSKIKKRLMWFGSLPFYIRRFYSPLLQDCINKEIKQKDYDLILVEFSYMAQYEFRENNQKLVLDAHNVESDLFYQMMKNNKFSIYNYLEFIKTRRFEKSIFKKFHKILSVSKEDKERILKLTLNSDVSIVPNGVDVNYFQCLPQQKDSKTIVFVGGLYYYPNIEGILHFYHETFLLVKEKIPDLTLYIIGVIGDNHLKKEIGDDRSVILTGQVEDIRPYFKGCALSIVPLRMGGGTRLKILESMAMGRVVVSTSKGCEGLDAVHKKEIIIADNPIEFAKNITRLIQDMDYREQLALAGRKFVEERYSWEKIVSEMEEILVVRKKPTNLFYEELKKEYVNCSLCGSSATKRLFKKESLNFVKCKKCGLVYLNPRLTKEAIKKFYDPGINRWTNLKDYIDMKLPLFEDLLNQVEKVKKGIRILDVGCGIGLFLKLAKERGWDAYGVDISSEDVGYAKEKYGLEIYRGTIKDASYPDNFFDAVTMWDVIEHLPDLLIYLKEARRILKKDGILFVLTGNIESTVAKAKGVDWEFLCDGSHLFFFSPQTLGKFLNLAGLTIITLPNSTMLQKFPRNYRIRKAMNKLKCSMRQPANIIDLIKKAYAILIKPKQTHNSSMMILATKKD